MLNIIIVRFDHDLIMNLMDGVHAIVRMSNRPKKKNDTVVPSKKQQLQQTWLLWWVV
jgi:hypothetical protein